MRMDIFLLATVSLAAALAAQASPDRGEVALKTKIQRRQKLHVPRASAP